MTITIDFAIPDWANWIAIDEDGRVYAYESKPHPVDGNPMEGQFMMSRHDDYDPELVGEILRDTPYPNWQKSLRRTPPTPDDRTAQPPTEGGAAT